MTQLSSLFITRRGLILAGGSSVFLAGCGGNLLGPSTPPLQLYLLEPVLAPVADLQTANWQLAIARPEAGESFNTQRIALERGEKMDYFADAQWTDGTPRLLQSLLVEAFEKSGKIAAVARETEAMHADYALETEIRDFAAHYASDNGPPDIVVSVVAKLVAHGDVIATINARHDARAGQNSIPSVVQAFDQALGATLNEIVGWTLRQPGPSGSGPSRKSRADSRN